MATAAVLVHNTIGEMDRSRISLIGISLIVNVMFLIVIVGRAITVNIAIPPSYTVEDWPASAIAVTHT